MDRVIVVRGRLTSPRVVELDEPVAEVGSQAEVILRTVNAPNSCGLELVEFIKGLPSGTRSREDIDRQLDEERSSWEKR